MVSGFIGGVLALLLALSPAAPALSSISTMQQVGAAAANNDAYSTRCEKGHVYVLVIGADGGMSITESLASNPDAIPIVSIITQSDGKVTRKVCTSGLVVDAAPQSSQPPSASALSSEQNIFESGTEGKTGSYAPASRSYFEYMQCAFGYGDCSGSLAGAKVSNNGQETTPLQRTITGQPVNDPNDTPTILISGDSVEFQSPKVDAQGKTLPTKNISQPETTFGRQDAPPSSASAGEPSWLDWRRILSVPGLIVCFLIPSDCKAYQYIKDRKKTPQQ